MKIVIGLILAAALLLPGTLFAADAEKVVTLYAGSKDAADNPWKLRNAAFEKATGIKVVLQMVPGTEDDFYDRTDVAVMSGDTTDCIRLTNPLHTNRYAAAGFLLLAGNLGGVILVLIVQALIGSPYLSLAALAVAALAGALLALRLPARAARAAPGQVRPERSP